MMNLIDASNRAVHTETLRSFAELRYEIFVRRLGWPLPDARDGLEEDEYDTARAIYVTVSNSAGQVIGGARLLDTADASLLNEVFPHLVKDDDLPRSPRIYEITRFAIDPRRERLEGCQDLRNRVLWGVQAAALHLGLQKMVSITYVHLEPMLRKVGYRFRRLGDVDSIDGIATVALEHEVSPEILDACRSTLLTGRLGRSRNRSASICPLSSLSGQPTVGLAQLASV